MNIEIELSKKSVNSAIKRLRQLEKNYPSIKKLFIRRSLEYIQERAKINIQSYEAETQASGRKTWYTPTGELMNSWVIDETIGLLSNVCDHAAWYEYGTGSVGASNPHPKKREGYEYDVNNHGADGWWFKFEDEWRWIRGMKAHPYLHNAVKDYIHTNKYKEIFRNAVSEIEKGL